jgi:hypothetical protein
MKRIVFEYLAVLALVAVAAGMCCCAPSTPKYLAREAAGTYLISAQRPFGVDDGDFDIRKTVKYPETVKPVFNSDLLVSNRQLTTYRCAWCHECGFPQAWDLANVGKPDWHPRYKGTAWQPIVQRMSVMDGSMLNEEIADRIYSYLRDASLGVYDESKDPHGATIRNVDKMPDVIDSPESAAKKRQAEEKQREAQHGWSDSGKSDAASGSGSGDNAQGSGK